MRSSAKTAQEYIEELAPERRNAMKAVRKVILDNLPKGYEETMQYGMIAYVVPLSLYPAGYLSDSARPLLFAALASQKNHMAVYLMNLYADKKAEQWFIQEYEASVPGREGKKLDIGKSCVRFRKLENIPLDLVGKTIRRTPVRDFIAMYENTRKRHTEKR